MQLAAGYLRITMITFIRGCIEKFPDWPPGARTANGSPLPPGTVYRYFASQSGEFCHHNPSRCFSTVLIVVAYTSLST